MSKQTAVEWLEQEFIKLESTIGVYGIMYKLIEKAKEMEKEQIIEAFKHGNLPTFLGRTLTTEEYYNETYKNKS
jgi:hypothetical protein